MVFWWGIRHLYADAFVNASFQRKMFTALYCSIMRHIVLHRGACCRTIWYRVIHCDIYTVVMKFSIDKWIVLSCPVLYWAVLYCTYSILWCTAMQCTVLSSYYIVISWPYCAISVLVLSGMMSSSLIHSSMAWYTVVYCGKLCCRVETADAMFSFCTLPAQYVSFQVKCVPFCVLYCTVLK